jgi:MYXO-CTERM domain-containing protein
VVLADVSWSHPTDQASDSHYHVDPAPGTPSNWKSPIDYTQGSVYFALDVKTKPAGDAPTKFQVCFEGTPSYACADQSPTYTKTGHYTWTAQFSNFWYGGDVDWTKPVNQLALIVKDDKNNKPAGDPQYVPTDLHVLVVLLSKGASYVPVNSNAGAGAMAGVGGGHAANGGATAPAGAGGGAGSAGKSAADGGARPVADAGVDAGHPGDASLDVPDAAAVLRDAAASAGVGNAGSADAQAPRAAGSAASPQAVKPTKGSSCSTTPSGAGNAWPAVIVAALLLARRRRVRR